MTRVHSQRSQHGAHGASALDRSRAVRKKKPYKILFETVTQEKKKLHSILTYTANAPPGYSFVPAGHPDLTDYCKERCRKRNLDVHIVSAKPKTRAHADPEKISHHVHRIGHHFPNQVIGEACDVLGYHFRNGVYHKSNRDYADTRLARKLANYDPRIRLHGRPITETETKEQVRDAVRDMFPKIPEADLTAIIRHAFEEGSNRVGNAKELSLARKVQLAVVAHIRHTYTDYDHLLKVGSWADARSLVEPVSLAKVKEWRDEADSDELEETFREVIVIDDDDDDEEDADDDTLPGANEREPSLEIVSSRATARELQPNVMDEVARVDAHHVSRAPRRTIFLQPMHSASRSSALAGPTDTHSAQQVRAHARPAPILPAGPSQQYRNQPLHLAHSRPMQSRPRTRTFEPVRRAEHPLRMRGADGRLYNLQPIEESNGNTRAISVNSPRIEYVSSPSTVPRYSRDPYVQPSQRVDSLESNYPNSSAPVPSRRPSEQDVILPSVEREAESVPSPRRIADTPHQFQHNYSSASSGYPGVTQSETESLKRKALPAPRYDTGDRHHEQMSKRLKPVHTGDEMLTGTRRHRTVMPRQTLYYEPMDIPTLPRVQQRHEVIDLTSSPNRPPVSRNREGYAIPARSYVSTQPRGYSYVPVQSRRSPNRDTRDACYRSPAMEPSRDHLLEYPRMIERHALPARGYSPGREELPRSQFPVGDRVTRNGLDYGG